MNIYCNKCERDLDISEFSKNPKKKLGVNNICRDCHSKYRREHYISNKEKVYKQVRSYRQNNLEKYKNVNSKSYNRKSRVVIEGNIFIPKHHSFSKKAGRTIEDNCIICNNIIYKSVTDIKTDRRRFCSKECRATLKKSKYYNYLYDIKKRAKKINREFLLTEEFIKHLLEFKQSNKCAITNVPISLNEPTIDKTIYETASLDRINSLKGYTEDNVQWVALGINYMKLDHSEEDMHKLLKLIKENYIQVPKAAVVSTLQKCDL